MARKLTKEDFIARAKQVHGDKYDYSKSEYCGKDKPLIVICPIHGEFKQTPNNHWKGKGCAKCSGNHKLTLTEFIKKANEIHNNKYDYSNVNYVNTNTPVSIICPIHGSFIQTPSKHLAGRGCPSCGIDKMKSTNYEKYGVVYSIASKTVQDKIKKSFLNKYGVDNPGTLNFVKERIRKTNMKKFGVPYAIASDSVRKKSQDTLFAKYGVNTPFASELIRDKAKQTMMNIYNVTTPILNPIIAKKIQNTNIIQYGYKSPLESPKIQEKCNQSLISNYGVKNPAQSGIIKDKIKNTLLEKYGVTSTFASDTIREKSKQTMLARYGTEYPMQSNEIKEKSKKTCVEKYGATHPMKTEYVKNKVYKTKRERKSFNTSKPEENLYQLLINVFGINNVLRQYSSDVYPFACDFYISSIDAYIELNANWTHGEHPFDKNNASDIAKMNLWKELSNKKHSRFYLQAIETWTLRDVAKYETAKKNHLNYIVFWDNDLTDAKQWIQGINV